MLTVVALGTDGWVEERIWAGKKADGASAPVDGERFRISVAGQYSREHCNGGRKRGRVDFEHWLDAQEPSQGRAEQDLKGMMKFASRVFEESCRR